MIAADSIDDEQFAALPVVALGESKEVRDLGDGLVAIAFRPSVYSYTENRGGEVPGTDALRLRATRVFCDVLRESGVEHAYLDVGRRFVVARRVIPPPIEVIVKASHVGTPKHRYHGMEQFPVRSSHARFGGRVVRAEQPYPEPWVRFDWRNPMHDATGRRLADEVLAEPLAELWIDVASAKRTATRAFAALTTFLDERGIALLDICFFMTEDGTTIFGEVSPDCARFRASGDSLDKDVFRSGGSSARVLEKYTALVARIEA